MPTDGPLKMRGFKQVELTSKFVEKCYPDFFFKKKKNKIVENVYHLFNFTMLLAKVYI